MKISNFKAFSIIAASLVSIPTLFAQTYYWANGSFNQSVFYPNVDATGEAVIPNWTDGTTIIDKAAIATGASQYAFYVQNINIAEWNDTTANSAQWHMYFSSSNGSLTMKSMTKTSDGILKIRTSTGSSGAVLNVNDSMDLSAGSLRIGTDSEFGISDGWAFNTVNINTLNMSGTATATFAVSNLMKVDTVNMNGGKWWVGAGSETTGGVASLILEIGTLNVGTRTQDATLNDLSISSTSAKISNLNITGTSEGRINNYVQVSNDGVLRIENMHVDEGFLSGGKFGLLNGTLQHTINVASFTSNTGVAAGGNIELAGNVTFEKSVHTGSGSLLGNYVYDLIFTGGGTAILNDITVEKYAQIGYGKFAANNASQQTTMIGGVSLGKVNVNSGGYLWIVSDNVQFDREDSIIVSGQDSKMVIMNGSNGSSASLLGNISVLDGGSFIVRRRAGSPAFTLGNISITSTSTDRNATVFQVSSDSTYTVGSASIESITFNPNADGVTGKESYANLYSVKQDVGSESMYVGSVVLNEYASGVISVAQNTKIGSITSAANSVMDFTSSGGSAYTITVDGDYTNAGQYIILRQNMTLNVKGDFINNSFRTNLYGVDINLANSGTLLDIDGAFVNNGIANLGTSISAGKTANYCFGGIRSDYIVSKQETFRIHNTNGGVVNVTLDGDGTYIYGNRIHTFGSTSTDMGTSVINFNKTGSGTQYFASKYIYFKGTTTISAGEMYMYAAGTNNSHEYGVENIVLSGGKFGACGVMGETGSVGSIGTVKAENFTWSSGAEVAVDFDAEGNCDLILISGSFVKGSSDAADAKYNFVFSGNVVADTEYKIFGWEDGATVDFSEGDFTYTSDDGIEGTFAIKDNSLYFTATVPEPSTYAAIFGFVALCFAALKRRRK